ncbi:MAG TPA: ACP S-malonyltransferase [Armatimonadota bacterium]|jgi:[acyl-carrier-protein] S-malonyltransferase
MSKTLVFIFPGQGSQFVGMAADLAADFPVVAATLAEANETLGLDLAQIMGEGPAEALTATENAQPALLTHSVALTRVLAEAGVEPSLVAGHSLGEYSALVAAGALSFPAALQLVRARGLAMATAGATAGGAMAAIIGLDDAAVEQAVSEAAQEGLVVVANYNSPGQVVISGEAAAVARAGELAKAAGARGALPLKVSGAFHSPLMAPAAAELAPVLEAAPLNDARVPVVSNIDAEPRQAAAELREALARQITGSVRWTESVRRMIAAGGECFVEVGPGDVLTKLMKRIDPEATALSTSTTAGVRAALASLAE